MLAALLAAGALLAWPVPRERLDWQGALALAQPWRWWSAVFVHWSGLHLGANLLGCAVVAWFGWTAGTTRSAAWAWFAAWPLTHLALLTQPALLHYGGLSGVLHAGVAITALWLVLRASGKRRAIGAAVLAGLAVKLVLERPWLGPAQQTTGWDIAIAPSAHVTGVAAGLVCGALALAFTQRPAQAA